MTEYIVKEHPDFPYEEPKLPELIRCKDCKYHHRDSKGIPYCANIDYGYGWKDEDYCSRAERREK